MCNELTTYIFFDQQNQQFRQQVCYVNSFDFWVCWPIKVVFHRVIVYVIKLCTGMSTVQCILVAILHCVLNLIFLYEVVCQRFFPGQWKRIIFNNPKWITGILYSRVSSSRLKCWKFLNEKFLLCYFRLGRLLFMGPSKWTTRILLSAVFSFNKHYILHTCKTDKFRWRAKSIRSPAVK